MGKLRDHNFDVIIIGGGPAGMAAALWCDELGREALLLEKESSLGGQLHWIHNPIRNYPGREAVDGSEMLAFFNGSIAKRGFVQRVSSAATAVDTDRRVVTADSGEKYCGEKLLIATGVRRRKLGVPGEERFVGKGIAASGSKDPTAAAGKRVVIVGGGDAAFENALILRPYAASITIVHRSDKISARQEFREKVAADRSIELLINTEVAAINGEDRVSEIVLRKSENDVIKLAADMILLRIGVQPNTEFLSGQVDLDAGGYIRVDRFGNTSAPNIYAAGDVANPFSLTLATAVGSAVTVVKALPKI